MTEINQEKRIKKEITKLKKFIVNLDRDEQNMAMNLIIEIGFMKVTLEDLKKEVNSKGVITEMPQGDYSIERENPALKSYNAIIQRYNSAIKQLDDFITKTGQTSEIEGDSLIAHLAKK